MNGQRNMVISILADFQTELWTEEEIEIFSIFNFRCPRCNRRAVTLHEICPKSKCPKTWMKPENRMPLCANCHEWAHSRGTNNSREELQKLRNSIND